MPNNVTASAITNAVYTLLSAVAELQQVKIGRDGDHDGGFPFCRVFLVGVENPVEDTKSYLRKYRFLIEVIQETTAKSKRDAELDWQAACDAVLGTLQQNWQLGAAGVQNSVVEQSAVRTAEINGGPMVAMQITLAVETLHVVS